MPSSAQVSVSPPLHPFRPLFFCAALAASLGMLAWGVSLHFGWSPSTTLLPITWHAHAMLYGFASALVGGFLLTASANWSGMATTTRTSLWTLTILWALARVAFLTQLPIRVGSVLELMYIIGLSLLVGRVLWLSRNKRNAFLIAVLLLYAGLDVAFFIGAMRMDMLLMNHALIGAVDLLTLLMLVIGGRVIPFFTQRKLSGHTTWDHKYLVWSVNGGALLVLLCGLIGAHNQAHGMLMIVLAALTFVRLLGWHGERTWREPMLWVLHLGYLWLAIGLLMRGLALIGVWQIPEIDALHGITVGALGTLSLGMMTRVAQGHSGVPIQANTALAIMFALPTVTAILRLGFNQPNGWMWAALTWFAAYAIYLIVIGPLLIQGKLALLR